MPETPTPETPPAPSELAALRSLLRRIAEVVHRGLHELNPHGPSPTPSPAPPTLPGGVEPAPGPRTPVGEGGATPIGGGVPAGGGPIAPPEPPAPPSLPEPPAPPATETGNPSTRPHRPPSGSDPTEPATPLPTPPTTEPPKMPIGTRNFAFAHARIESDGERVRVTRSTGFTPAITHPTDADPARCATSDDLPKVAKIKPEDAGKLPPNTLLYRLLLPENHQIDKSEAVVMASGATRETLGHYRVSAWTVDDRTVEVSLEILRPDVNAKASAKFSIDVLVFRVD